MSTVKTSTPKVEDFTPAQDYVLIRQDKRDSEKTAGGLYLPESKQRPPQSGVVLKVGPGIKKNGVIQPMDVKVGDRVEFTLGQFWKVVVAGEELIVVKEVDIIGIYET